MGLGFRASVLVAGAVALASCSSGGGDGSCTTNADCESGQICISFSCRGSTGGTTCTNDDDCAIGFFCDPATSACAMNPADEDGGTTPRDAGENTNPGRDGGVGYDGGGTGECQTDPECGTPPIDICVANQCVKGCNEPDGIVCTGGTTCDASGHCVQPNMTCNVDTDCNPGPPTQVCIANVCVFGCGVDPTLCQTGEICDSGTGRCVTAPMPCMTDVDCSPPMSVCEAPQCVPGCNQPGGIQCAAPTPMCDTATGRCTAGATCNLDADCTGTDEICVNNACVIRCNATGGIQCVAPQVCNASTGRCVAGNLPLGDPCADDSQCASGFCFSLTIMGTSHEVCSAPCGRGGDCPVNFTCAYVSGMSFCLGENLLTPQPNWDTPAGGSCSSGSNTCQTGWCNTGTNQCIETCQRDQHCSSFGGQCWSYEQTGTGGTTFDHLCVAGQGSNIDGAACTTNANCRSGVCNRYSNTCSNHCCSDADCTALQSCVVYDLDAATIVKVCATRTPGAGTAALGATCTAAADCESEVCIPTDPANMASPRRCSTTCCTNADCNALPAGGRCRPIGSPVMNTIVGACIPN